MEKPLIQISLYLNMQVLVNETFGIIDIAHKLRIFPSTVLCVLNKHPDKKKETKVLVWKTA
jgi:hypothetical protein